MNHCFDVALAAKFGVNQAILLENISYWIDKNRANEKHQHDGLTWTYNSVRAFSELFPYMSTRQISSALASLIEQGILVTGNYNANSYDRTKWFAITKVGYSIIQKCKMDFAEMANPFAENGEPIPIINTDINTDINKERSDSTESSPSPDKPSLPIEAYDLADLLQRLHHEHVDAKAKFTDAQVDAWAHDIDKLHRIDGRDWQDIEAVITYAKTMEPTSSGFSWAPNVISGAKLRKQFTTIYGQMQVSRKSEDVIPPEMLAREAEKKAKHEAMIQAMIRDGYTEEEARAYR